MTEQLRADTSRTRMDPADILTRAGRHWGWALAFGVLTVAVGIVALVWPGRTLLVIAVLFGIQLIVAGIFRFVGAFASSDLSGGTRVLYAVLGLLSLVIGLYAVRHILLTLLALVLLLGIFWVVNGVVELFAALSHREMPDRGWTGFMGVLSILAGIVVLVYPGLSLFVLDVVISVWLVVFGIMEISLALRARSALHAIHAT
ncbi:MAG TPA: HdeD family acid-resistance protein [Streptosporangiaceae bacterium]|nr:HdeD family acid-resistance protein [Streptosporangiaceae bacterium]